MASRLLSDCVPELVEKIPLIIKDYEELFTDRSLIITCSLRSTEEQQQIYAVGRTKAPLGKKFYLTQIDGIKILSFHNPTPDQPLSRAVDMGVIVGGKYITDNTFYYPLLDIARKYNLTSGLDFKNSGKPLTEILKNGEFHDCPHLQVRK